MCSNCLRTHPAPPGAPPPAGRGSAPSHGWVSVPGRASAHASPGLPLSAAQRSHRRVRDVAACVGSRMVGSRGGPTKPWCWGTCFQRHPAHTPPPCPPLPVLQHAVCAAVPHPPDSDSPPAPLPPWKRPPSSLGGTCRPHRPGGHFAPVLGDSLLAPTMANQGRVDLSIPQGRPRNAAQSSPQTHTLDSRSRGSSTRRVDLSGSRGARAPAHTGEHHGQSKWGAPPKPTSTRVEMSHSPPAQP